MSEHQIKTSASFDVEVFKFVNRQDKVHREKIMHLSYLVNDQNNSFYPNKRKFIIKLRNDKGKRTDLLSEAQNPGYHVSGFNLLTYICMNNRLKLFIISANYFKFKIPALQA